MNKTYVEMLVEHFKAKQIGEYRKSQDHKLQGDIYSEVVGELVHALDCDKAAAAQSTSKVGSK